jgi:putative transposase
VQNFSHVLRGDSDSGRIADQGIHALF